MLTVLITGSMGAGKSSVVAYLKTKACPVFQADVKAKTLLSPKSPCYSRLKEIFYEQPHLVYSRGGFNKKKLAQAIFKSPEKRKAIEAVIHPLVQKAFKEFVEDQKKKDQYRVFYEAPLISEDIFDRFDRNILVVCPEDLKMKRLVKRGWTKKEIKDRWAVQIPDSAVLNKVDFVVDNKGEFKDLNEQVDKILSSLN